MAYADNTIILASANNYFVGRIMMVLQKYEQESGENENKDKSFLYTHQNSSTEIVQQMEIKMGTARGTIHFKYLGCPISHSKKKEHYDDLLDKVRNKLQAWKGRLLSYRGKEVLLKSFCRVSPCMFYQQ